MKTVSFHIALREQSNPVLARSLVYDVIPKQPTYFPSHQTPKAFYITLRRQTDPALRENYAFELHQVKILRPSRAGMTS
jgi:hypothetical protein